MGVFSKFIVEVDTIFKTVNGKTVSESEKRVESLGRGITRTTTQMTKYDAKGKEMVITTERNTRGFQKFQMEHLGVMFAGMALNRSMKNLSASAREWTGMNELMSTAMGVVMLPATMDLLNLGILPLFDALTNLPEPAQKAIGETVIVLEGLGGVMAFGGQLMLGLASTALVLEKMGGAANTAKFALKGLAGITIVGIGVSLGIASVMAEDGTTAVIYSLGTGLAIALGAPLLGASVTTGIALGGITVASLLLFRFSAEIINKAELYDQLGQDVNDLGDFLSGEAQKRGFFLKGTREITPPTFPGSETFQVSPDLFPGAKSSPGGGPSVIINQTNTVTGFDMSAVTKEINKNNQSLTSEVRRIIKV